MAQTETTRTVKRFRPKRNRQNSTINLQPDETGLHMVHHMVDIASGALALLLGIRFVVNAFGISTASGFGQFVTFVTQPLVRPFVGIVPDSPLGAMNGGRVETATVLSMIAMAFLGYAIQQLIYAFEHEPVYEPELKLK